MSFRFAPRIPDDFHWWCEIENCYHDIDMLNLTVENLAMLDGETAAKLRLQDWSSSDPWVRLAFKAMVEDHRVKHLGSWGLKCTGRLYGVCHGMGLPLSIPLLTAPVFRPVHTSNLSNPQHPIRRRTSSRTSSLNFSIYCDSSKPLPHTV